MSKRSIGVVVYPRDCDFQVLVGSVGFGSRQYANSSNTYRGARAAVKNMLKNRNITNESNYGAETVAIVNNNNYVLAANEYSRSATAKQAVKRVLTSTAGIKKLNVEVVRD